MWSAFADRVGCTGGRYSKSGTVVKSRLTTIPKSKYDWGMNVTPKQAKQNVAPKLHDLLSKCDVSANAVAEMMGMHPSALHRYRCGESEISGSALASCSAYFSVSEGWLLTHQPTKKQIEAWSEKYPKFAQELWPDYACVAAGA